jgi:hypothetical protein
MLDEPKSGLDAVAKKKRKKKKSIPARVGNGTPSPKPSEYTD